MRDDSPAAQAGLKAGDKIVKMAGRDVRNVYDYTAALGEMKAGQEYEVEIVRGTERLKLKLTPAGRKVRGKGKRVNRGIGSGRILLLPYSPFFTLFPYFPKGFTSAARVRSDLRRDHHLRHRDNLHGRHRNCLGHRDPPSA